VNEGGGHVKCEKSKQPKNNQYRGDYTKHLFISVVPERENICDLALPNCAGASL
jgi:hypothetical protein